MKPKKRREEDNVGRFTNVPKHKRNRKGPNGRKRNTPPDAKKPPTDKEV